MDDTNQNSSVTEKGLGAKIIPGHMVINSNVDEKAHWYVVHTYSGHEARVAETLRQRVATLGQTDKVFELLIPTQDKIQIKHGKKSTVKEKIFPGYLLVKMIVDDDSWLVVRTTQGITGFVGTGNKPTPLSVKEVEAIMQFASMGAPKYKANFSVGEAVKITDGPFSVFLGSVESIDEEHGKIKVLVSIFGRETPVELDFMQVKKI
jgi:transcription termination/antitermination protein NusG